MTHRMRFAIATLATCGALTICGVARSEPPAGPRDGPAEGSERGMTVEPSAEALPIAPTPATDYAQRHYAHRIAVTIGINAYPGRPWPQLRAAVPDARHIAELFRAMGFDRVETLEDEAATRAGILELLEQRLPLVVGERDLVVIFFSGHGATFDHRGYIIPRDAGRDLERTAIAVQRLKDSVLRTRARHTLFVMDACFSGVMLRRARAEAETTNQLAYWDAAAHDRVVQILTAGQANEPALESGGWGRFTRAIHAGLAGAADLNRDGVVTARELAVYADHRVEREVHGRQHPQWGTLEGSGTALLLDMRRLPASGPRPLVRTRSVIRGLEEPLGRIHAWMERRDWQQAERGLRDLMIDHADLELRLLLAEVYLEADALGNARLIEAELRRVADRDASPEQRQRMLELWARLAGARREPM